METREKDVLDMSMYRMWQCVGVGGLVSFETQSLCTQAGGGGGQEDTQGRHSHDTPRHGEYFAWSGNPKFYSYTATHILLNIVP
jgi:hypothetical protein